MQKGERNRNDLIQLSIFSNFYRKIKNYASDDVRKAVLSENQLILTPRYFILFLFFRKLRRCYRRKNKNIYLCQQNKIKIIAFDIHSSPSVRTVNTNIRQFIKIFIHRCGIASIRFAINCFPNRRCKHSSEQSKTVIISG